ncbi:MAG: hypothetical protein LBB45_03320 [Methanobrevibacter sp.]|jgi:archaellum component FlaC|nr:hypothetical protein [Candidatus Methanovirga basalitermitum]
MAGTDISIGFTGEDQVTSIIESVTSALEKLSDVASSIGSNMSSLEDSLTESANGFNKINDDVEETSKSFTDMESSIDSLTDDLESVESVASELGDSFNSLDSDMSNVSNSFEDVNTSMESLVDSAEHVTINLDELNNYTNNISNDMNNISDSAASAGSALGDMASEIGLNTGQFGSMSNAAGGLFDSLSNLANGGTITTTALAAVGVSLAGLINYTGEVNDSWSRLEGITTSTGGSFDSLKNSISSVSQETATSVGSLRSAATSMELYGASTEQVEKILPNLGVGAFYAHKSVDQLGQTMSVLASRPTAMARSFTQLGTSLKQVAEANGMTEKEFQDAWKTMTVDQRLAAISKGLHTSEAEIKNWKNSWSYSLGEAQNAINKGMGAIKDVINLSGIIPALKSAGETIYNIINNYLIKPFASLTSKDPGLAKIAAQLAVGLAAIAGLAGIALTAKKVISTIKNVFGGLGSLGSSGGGNVGLPTPPTVDTKIVDKWKTLGADLRNMAAQFIKASVGIAMAMALITEAILLLAAPMAAFAAVGAVSSALGDKVEKGYQAVWDLQIALAKIAPLLAVIIGLGAIIGGVTSLSGGLGLVGIGAAMIGIAAFMTMVSEALLLMILPLTALASVGVMISGQLPNLETASVAITKLSETLPKVLTSLAMLTVINIGIDLLAISSVIGWIITGFGSLVVAGLDIALKNIQKLADAINNSNIPILDTSKVESIKQCVEVISNLKTIQDKITGGTIGSIIQGILQFLQIGEDPSTTLKPQLDNLRKIATVINTAEIPLVTDTISGSISAIGTVLNNVSSAYTSYSSAAASFSAAIAGSNVAGASWGSFKSGEAFNQTGGIGEQLTSMLTELSTIAAILQMKEGYDDLKNFSSDNIPISQINSIGSALTSISSAINSIPTIEVSDKLTSTAGAIRYTLSALDGVAGELVKGTATYAQLLLGYVAALVVAAGVNSVSSGLRAAQNAINNIPTVDSSSIPGKTAAVRTAWTRIRELADAITGGGLSWVISSLTGASSLSLAANTAAIGVRGVQTAVNIASSAGDIAINRLNQIADFLQSVKDAEDAAKKIVGGFIDWFKKPWEIITNDENKEKMTSLPSGMMNVGVTPYLTGGLSDILSDLNQPIKNSRRNENILSNILSAVSGKRKIDLNHNVSFQLDITADGNTSSYIDGKEDFKKILREALDTRDIQQGLTEAITRNMKI